MGTSRDDLRLGDVVRCTSEDAALTEMGYAWTLAHAPSDEEGNPSGAVLAVEDNYCEFTVDKDGPYLVRLVVDPGTEHEDEQYLRLRVLTKFGSLKLVAAGEQMGDVVIPSDLTGYGWAADQNHNLLELVSHISKVSTSGRVLYVDANRGTDDTADPNVDIEGCGHYSSIQEAIDHATDHVLDGAADDVPWTVFIQPGFYEEQLVLAEGVHLVGLGYATDNEGSQGSVTVSNTEPHKLYGGSVKGVSFINRNEVQDECIQALTGRVVLEGCYILMAGVGATQGPCVRAEDVDLLLKDCTVLNNSIAIHATYPGYGGVVGMGSSNIEIVGCDVQGAEGIVLDSFGYGFGFQAHLRVRQSVIRSSTPEGDVAEDDSICAIRSVSAGTIKIKDSTLTNTQIETGFNSKFRAVSEEHPASTLSIKGGTCHGPVGEAAMVDNVRFLQEHVLRNPFVNNSLTLHRASDPDNHYMEDDLVLWNDASAQRIKVKHGADKETVAYISDLVGQLDVLAHQFNDFADGVGADFAANEAAHTNLQAQIDALLAASLGGDSNRFLERTVVTDLEYECHDCDVYLAVKTQAGLDTIIHLEAEPLEGRRLYVVDETGLGRILVRPETVEATPATINGNPNDLVLKNRAAVHLVCGGTTESGLLEWFLS